MEKARTPLKVLPTEMYFSLIRAQLSENGRADVRVTGNSMRPLLRHLRDGVAIVPPDRIRWGDIVLFDRRNGRYALHRVVRRRGDRFDMAGDSQWHVERGLPCDQIVGVVSGFYRDDRFIPSQNFFLRICTFGLTAMTFPRIYIWKAVRWLARPFRRRSQLRKGGYK